MFEPVRNGRRGVFSRRHRKSYPFGADSGHKVDYKDVKVLQRYISERGKIVPLRVTGVSAKQQRRLASAIKRARCLGLLPFVVR